MYFTVLAAGILGFIALWLNSIFKKIGLEKFAEDHFHPDENRKLIIGTWMGWL